MLAHPERREHAQFAQVKLTMNSTFFFECRKNKSDREKFNKILECHPDIENMTQIKKVEYLFKTKHNSRV